MSNGFFDCIDCPRFDLKNKCCHQSILPVPSLNMARAVEVAQMHQFDRTNWNVVRFARPSYIKKGDKYDAR